MNLRKTTLNIKDAEECASVYGAVDFDQNYMICAGSGKECLFLPSIACLSAY